MAPPSDAPPRAWLPRLNIAPLVRFVEGASLPRIFAITVMVPFAAWLCVFCCLQHTGSSFAVTEEVEFDISIGGEAAGTLVVGLFGRQVPDTVRNFRVLAGAGHRGHRYAGSAFHRVVKGFLLQGGDVAAEGDQRGSGRLSIYGDTFPDENFAIPHTGPYLVGMANTGPDSNGCQFYIATCAASWLDGRHVVFGKVVRNTELVHRMEEVEVDAADRPVKEVAIVRARTKRLKDPYQVSTDPYNLWDYLWGMSVPLGFTFALVCVFGRLTTAIGRGVDAEDSANKQKSRASARVNRRKLGNRCRSVEGGACRRRGVATSIQEGDEEVVAGEEVDAENEVDESGAIITNAKLHEHHEDSVDIQQNSTEEEDEEEVMISLDRKTSLPDDVLNDIKKHKAH